MRQIRRCRLADAERAVDPQAHPLNVAIAGRAHSPDDATIAAKLLLNLSRMLCVKRIRAS